MPEGVSQTPLSMSTLSEGRTKPRSTSGKAGFPRRLSEASAGRELIVNRQVGYPPVRLVCVYHPNDKGMKHFWLALDTAILYHVSWSGW